MIQSTEGTQIMDTKDIVVLCTLVAVLAMLATAAFYELELHKIQTQLDVERAARVASSTNITSLQAETDQLADALASAPWSFGTALARRAKGQAIGGGVSDEDLKPLFENNIMLGFE